MTIWLALRPENVLALSEEFQMRFEIVYLKADKGIGI